MNPPSASSSNNNNNTNNKPILVICDLQPDLLGSLDATSQQDLLDALGIVVEAARNHKWKIFYNCLQFSSDYKTVPTSHKLYGAFRKLHSKLGDQAVHWFLEGWEGSQVLKEPASLAPRPEIDLVVTREQHLPHELIQSIMTTIATTTTTADDDDDGDNVDTGNVDSPIIQSTTQKVYLTGAKASGSVQITAQMLMDQGFQVCCIAGAIQDDNWQKKQTVLQHILPIYSESVLSLPEFVEQMGGLETFSKDSQQAFVEHAKRQQQPPPQPPQQSTTTPTTTPTTTQTLVAPPENNKSDAPNRRTLCDCGRRGHGANYMQLLLKRRNEGGSLWQTYPTQIWYEDLVHGEYYCPLGKQIVDFCDEPEFSAISMYLLGREWLDEKDKFLDIANLEGQHQYMPKTYCFEKGKWRHGLAPDDDDNDDSSDGRPWFVKEANKNLGGAAINIVANTSEIAQHLLLPNDKRYVVQAHIRDPLLTEDEKKTHIKFYVLLVCENDGITWTLYTYKASLLSISPNPWSATDLSHDTQVTIHRHPEPPEETEGWKQHNWEEVYQKCKEGTARVIQRAIAMGKLKGRKRPKSKIGKEENGDADSKSLFQKQFEVFSVDWMPDTHGNVWVLECNLSPAIAQPEFQDPSHRDARRDYLMRHDEEMLKEALEIVLPTSGHHDQQKPSDYGQWDFAGTFHSEEQQR